jgi:hypothetical protein
MTTLPLYRVDELVGEIRAAAALARIEADSACRAALDPETVAVARTKRERAEWLAGILADAESAAAGIRAMQS